MSFPLIRFHAGFQLGGPLTMVLMVLFTLVIASGIFGVVLQQFIPRMMLARLPHETIYEQIDSVVGQLAARPTSSCRAVVGRLPAARDPARRAERRGGRGSAGRRRVTPARPRVRRAPAGDVGRGAVLKDVYLTEIRPFLAQQLPRHGRLRRAAERPSLFTQLMNAPAPAAATP